MRKFILIFISAALLVSCNSKNDQTLVTEEEKKDTLPVSPPNINPFTYPDVSPMDMIYFPQDYPKLKMARDISTPPVMRVIYSRPHLQGRKLFKNLQQYEDYWRLGANEATEIEFFQEVKIQKKEIKKGRYVMYCIPKEKIWTIFLNTNTDTWGLVQDISKNIHFFEIPVTKENPHAEYLTMWFEKNKTGADLIITWDDLLVKLPIEIN